MDVCRVRRQAGMDPWGLCHYISIRLSDIVGRKDASYCVIQKALEDHILP